MVRSGTLGTGPILKWVPDDPVTSEKMRKDSGNYVSGSSTQSSGGMRFGSLNDREWTVVSEGDENSREGLTQLDRSVMLNVVGTADEEYDQGMASKGKVVVRPINIELSELKSFQLSDDGNQLVLIHKDGTKNNPLIFLHEGQTAVF